uniref:Uncharacterized protein n=1 Tax=Timema shepardi TaxID=629360 RepID=A0A7R9G118_TIMSH|nr:unnamed protein product [Timema shepardi]
MPIEQEWSFPRKFQEANNAVTTGTAGSSLFGVDFFRRVVVCHKKLVDERARQHTKFSEVSLVISCCMNASCWDCGLLVRLTDRIFCCLSLSSFKRSISCWRSSLSDFHLTFSACNSSSSCLERPNTLTNCSMKVPSLRKIAIFRTQGLPIGSASKYPEQGSIFSHLRQGLPIGSASKYPEQDSRSSHLLQGLPMGLPGLPIGSASKYPEQGSRSSHLLQGLPIGSASENQLPVFIDDVDMCAIVITGHTLESFGLIGQHRVQLDALIPATVQLLLRGLELS